MLFLASRMRPLKNSRESSMDAKDERRVHILVGQSYIEKDKKMMDALLTKESNNDHFQQKRERD